MESPHSFHLKIQNNTTFKDVFSFLRTQLNLQQNDKVTFEISLQSKNNTWVKFAEDDRDRSIGPFVLHTDLYYTIQRVRECDATNSSENSESARLCLKYFPWRSADPVDLGGFVEQPESGENEPRSIEQLTKEVQANSRIQEVVAADLEPFLVPHLPLQVAKVYLLTNNGFCFQQIDGVNITNKENLSVVPLIQIAEEEIEDAKETLLHAELKFTSNARRSLRTAVYLLVPDRLRAGALEKLLETVVLQMALTNPENQEPFEPEYVRRNLRLCMLIGHREYELDQLQDLVLKDLSLNSQQLLATVSTDSFRNNIKINI